MTHLAEMYRLQILFIESDQQTPGIGFHEVLELYERSEIAANSSRTRGIRNDPEGTDRQPRARLHLCLA